MSDTTSVLADIRDKRANFEDAVQRAAAAGSPIAFDVEKVLSDFTALEAEVEKASGDDADALTEKAERLERLRAYVYPPAEVEFEGKTAFADLRQWGVPPAIVGPLEAVLLPAITGADLPAARGALRTLYGQYDYWAWYVDWYTEFMERAAWILVALEVVVLAVAVNRLFYRDMLAGFIASGLCGAIISVVAKMPELQADAEGDVYIRRILKRIGTGLAATVIGAGLLASGIVTVGLPIGDFAKLLDGCGKRASEAGPACATTTIFVLFAIAALFGLSERALTSFEEKVFPPSAPPPATAPRSVVPPPAPPGR